MNRKCQALLVTVEYKATATSFLACLQQVGARNSRGTDPSMGVNCVGIASIVLIVEYWTVWIRCAATQDAHVKFKTPILPAQW